MNKKMVFVRVILIIIALFLLVSCDNEKNQGGSQIEVQDILTATYITPDNGIGINEAILATSNYLRDEVIVKGDFEGSLEFKEITTKELWENDQIQLFQVKVSYAWFDGVAIFQSGEFIGMLTGQQTIGILASDLDSNGTYDICLNSNLGSGIINSYIQVFDMQSKSVYELNLRADEIDIFVKANPDENHIDVYYKDLYSSMDKMAYEGYLSIEDQKIKVQVETKND